MYYAYIIYFKKITVVPHVRSRFATNVSVYSCGLAHIQLHQHKHLCIFKALGTIQMLLLGCISVLRIDAAYCYRWNSVVCLSVCLSVTIASPAKNRLNQLRCRLGCGLGDVDLGGPKEPCIRRGQDTLCKGAILRC